MKLLKYSWALLGAILAAVVVFIVSANEDVGYPQQVENWRQERADGLQRDKSWLTVAGLYWLRGGESSIGSDGTNDFVLPRGPAVVGVFSFDNGSTEFRPQPGVPVRYHDEAIAGITELETGEKNALVIDEHLSMWVHKSGDRFAIRLRDLESDIRKDFVGLSWFPVAEKYRVTARFEAFDEPKPVEILNILGDIERYQSPGNVFFELGGQQIRMEPVSAREGRLWLIFRDGTSGKESYPAARFLTSEAAPENGEVVFDFNKAVNPPCAFNPYTTCPMPAKDNRLKLRIEAGEKNYQKGHS